MARIVYGVSGEGSGHSSRASQMLRHLVASGHEVQVVSYDRGLRALRDDYKVTEVFGLHIVSRNNKVSTTRTIGRNLLGLRAGWPKLRAARELFKSFRPDCVISDFEPTSAYLARWYKVPLISLDNQHRMRFMDYPSVPGARFDELTTRFIIRAMVPRPCVSLVTTFYFGRRHNDHTFLFPPILRDNVLALTPSTEGHVLVYSTHLFDDLLAILRNFKEPPFRVYGFGERADEGNISFRPFSVDGFLADLASASGVIATAGFTLITEALHLGKPYLALPMRGQFEQMLNGHLLQSLGFGQCATHPDAQQIENFLAQRSACSASLLDYPRKGNGAITQKLDELLDDDLKLLRMHYDAL